MNNDVQENNKKQESSQEKERDNSVAAGEKNQTQDTNEDTEKKQPEDIVLEMADENAGASNISSKTDDTKDNETEIIPDE